MFEIAAAVVVTFLFFRTAKERNRDPWVWSLIGMVSFLVLMFVVGYLLRLVFGSLVTKDGFRTIFLIAKIGVGVMGAMVIKKKVLAQR